MDKKLMVLGAVAVGAVAWMSLSGGESASASEAPPAAAPTAREAPRIAAPASALPVAGAVSASAISARADRPFDCLIEPSQVVKLSAPVEGVIEAIGADRGQSVSKGQVVARLQSDVENVGLEVARARASNGYGVGSAESRLRFLAAKKDRTEKIRNHLAMTAVEEAQAEADVALMNAKEAGLTKQIAQLESEQAAKLLQQRIVRSPIDGVVTERVMSPGEFRSNEASHILTIAKLNPLHVEVFAPVSRFGQVNIGDRATIFPEDPVGGSYKATVKIIDRVFDAASGTFGVRLELRNPGNKIPGGLRCRIEFDA